MKFSESEAEAARLGMLALDRALVSLGLEPAAGNPDFRGVEPANGFSPTTALTKSGAAPVLFVFGSYLELRVGIFSELLMEEVSVTRMPDVQRSLENILRSSVTCRNTLWGSKRITFQLPEDPEDKPWLHLSSWGAAKDPALMEPFYAPYIGSGHA